MYRRIFKLNKTVKKASKKTLHPKFIFQKYNQKLFQSYSFISCYTWHPVLLFDNLFLPDLSISSTKYWIKAWLKPCLSINFPGGSHPRLFPGHKSLCRNWKAFHNVSHQVTCNNTYVVRICLQNTCPAASMCTLCWETAGQPSEREAKAQSCSLLTPYTHSATLENTPWHSACH